MHKSSSFKIYNASAGSGKTFNLVREYLTKILSAKSNLVFSQILALTFTNKAVAEMKERILSMLVEFSKNEIVEKPTEMFKLLKKELGVTSENLQTKSQSVLNAILHNYAAFDVSTIDKFNHRLIRTFSNDLKLPTNFEVELDVDNILAKAVDRLIDRAGKNSEITKLLLDFSKEKMEEDKSWDVAYDLYKIAEILKQDQHKSHVDALAYKSLKDFAILKTKLKTKINHNEEFLKNEAGRILNLFVENGFEESDLQVMLLNHFRYIKNLDFKNDRYVNQLQNKLENNLNLLKGKHSADKISEFERLRPEILSAYLALKEHAYSLFFLKNAYNHITPLSVLFEINVCLKEILFDENLVLITDFNKIISKEIKNQPAPYIYERIGERYTDYFLDEFQDTSILQWQNLVPLIDNSLSQETLSGKRGSTLLVGDAKQAIYRWRGGEPEQFIKLYNKSKNPFTIEPSIEGLKDNYRSRKTIVSFNNQFFKFISESVFTNSNYSDLYKASSQNPKREEVGLVEIQFLSKDIEDKVIEFNQKTLSIIQHASSDGYNLSDICILTRRNKDGAKIANFLSENGIEVVSSESLLLSNSPKVCFIISVLIVIENPENYEAKVDILKYLFDKLEDCTDENNFYVKNLDRNNERFFQLIGQYGFKFSINKLGNIPLYELTEVIVSSFKLSKESDAYVQFLLDEIYQYSQKSQSGISDFLEYWERKKGKLSVVSSTGLNAVRIMTIHKSKGLEFPIVIFPYASQKIYDDKGTNIWFPVESENFSGFDFLYIRLNKYLQELSELGKNIYETHRSQLELDSINLLYVTLTRAMDRLYILSENDAPKNKTDGYSRFSEIYQDFLRNLNMFEEGKLLYEFGLKSIPILGKDEKDTVKTISLISTPRDKINLKVLTNEGLLWDTQRKEAIEKGNLIHKILSLINYKEEAAEVVEKLVMSGEIEEEKSILLLNEIGQIINHEALREYYTPVWQIINEREIISSNGDLHKPDRIMINKQKQAIIFDYKSGEKKNEHKHQINLYAQLLVDMGYTVSKKYLVYVGDKLEIIEI